METLEQRIQRVVREEVAIVPYDSSWPELFRQEKQHLMACLPNDLIRRIERVDALASRCLQKASSRRSATPLDALPV